MSTVSSEVADEGAYPVRLFRSEDRDSYLDLHETVFGHAGDAWFDWKFVDNPYFEHVPVVVAVDGDRVIGAKSGVGFEVAQGGLSWRALQPGDTMVHPEYRRQGVYSQMTEFMKRAYDDGPAALFFNYPNHATLPGSLKHGWREVGTVTTRYRVHNPVEFVGASLGPVSAVAEPVARTVVSGALRVARTRAPSDDTLTVRRHPLLPVETLADLYRRSVPDRLHVVRDETYFDWRFGNPNWHYTAYTVERAGRPVLGAVVGRDATEGQSRAALTEVLPLRSERLHASAGERERRDAETALLDRVLREFRDVDVVTAADGSIHESVFSAFGFLPDTRPPLSMAASPSTLVAYPLTPEVERIGFDSLDDWVVGLGDRDTN